MSYSLNENRVLNEAEPKEEGSKKNGMENKTLIIVCSSIASCCLCVFIGAIVCQIVNYKLIGHERIRFVVAEWRVNVKPMKVSDEDVEKCMPKVM